ncbi:MAG TPA: PQQ-binding-like beta-propeller repeat protein, partial [Methanosarcinales archaeon]|nr:PQQ-binding-like beta-propeller repeat protein [Methanosarcinales archaeon]
MKKEENLKAAILIAIIIAVVSITPIASASDWEQFQKNNINSGYTADSAPVSDPELAWSNHTSGTGMGGIDITPIVADGAVYVIDYQGILWSFDATTGIENWNTDLTEGSGTFELSTPAYNDGIVYAALSSGSEGEGAGRVCAVYASNGTIRECEYYGLDTFQLNTPITYADGKIYLGNSKYGTKDISTYYCIDAGDVTDLIWSRTAPHVTGYYWAGAAIVGDYIIYGDDTAIVTCLYKDNGTFVDHINVSEVCGVTPVEEIRSSIVWDESTDRIYFTGKKPSPVSGHAYAVSFNAATGDLGDTCDWVRDIGYSTSTPVVYNGRVYVCIGGMYGDSGVRCLNEADGTIRYSINKGASQASPAVSVADGHVYIYFTTNVNNGSAYCIEDTGSALVEMWEWNPPEPDNQFILQGMAIADGYVYFGTDYGRVYALKEGQEQFDIPIYNGLNLIGIPLYQDDQTLNAVFGNNPVNLDKVRRFVPGEGYKTATYWSDNWVGTVSEVEPIEPEVGYEYERKGANYMLTVLGTRCTGTISTPIYNGMNLVGYVSFTEADLSTFGNNPVDMDKVRRFVSGEGYKTATYWSGNWVGTV